MWKKMGKDRRKNRSKKNKFNRRSNKILRKKIMIMWKIMTEMKKKQRMKALITVIKKKVMMERTNRNQ